MCNRNSLCGALALFPPSHESYTKTSVPPFLSHSSPTLSKRRSRGKQHHHRTLRRCPLPSYHQVAWTTNFVDSYPKRPMEFLLPKEKKHSRKDPRPQFSPEVLKGVCWHRPGSFRVRLEAETGSPWARSFLSDRTSPGGGGACRRWRRPQRSQKRRREAMARQMRG